MLGASFDAPADNRDFAAAQQFPFLLLSDEDRHVGVAYEVAREPSDDYAEYPRRISYLVDPDGMIQRAYDVTDVAGHADEVIADVERLQGISG